MNKNTSIQCAVTKCMHHCKDEDYCSLQKVSIGTHECDPKQVECTDCLSFSIK